MTVKEVVNKIREIEKNQSDIINDISYIIDEHEDRNLKQIKEWIEETEKEDSNISYSIIALLKSYEDLENEKEELLKLKIGEC